MAVKTRTELKSENSADFPDNITHLISPADLRGQMDDFADSMFLAEDLDTPGGPSSGSGSGSTVDTGEPYKIIMLSDGTVRAIPAGAVPPATPTGLAVIPRLTSASLTWTAVVGATSYQVTRDGGIIGTASSNSFRDTNVTIGATYGYRVASIDQYQQRSPASAPVSAFIDIALNQAPADVSITMWPTPIPIDGYSYVRVNALEVDVQTIAYVLSVDVGSLTSTPDPSVWILRI